MKNKRNLKRFIFSAIILSFVSLSIGSITYALFKHSSEADVEVKTAKIKMTTTLDSLKTYSADATLTEGDIVPGGDNLGDYSGTYYYKELSNGLFSNGGSAQINGNKLQISKMTPGDKVSFNLNIVNESNVSIKYRTVFEAADNSIDSLKLFSILDIKAFDSDLTGSVRYATDWTSLEPTNEPISTAVEVAFPLNEKLYSDTSCAIKFTVEAIQANIILNDEEPTYVDFSEAVVEKADDNSFKEVVVGNDNVNVKLNLNNNTIKALKEDNSKVNIDEGEVLTLKAENANTGNITIENGYGAIGYEIGLYTSNGDKVVSLESDIAINILIGSNQVVSKVYHSGVEVNQNNYSYDSTSGYITILSDSFSPFIVVSKTCNHTEKFNNKLETTCSECHSTQNVLIEEGASAKFEQSDTGYFAISYGGIPVTGYEWVEAVGDTLNFTNYTGSAQKTDGFKALTLEAGKSYVTHFKVTNIGESTLEFEYFLDTTSIDPSILEYLEISDTEIVTNGGYIPTLEILAPGKSEVVRFLVKVSDSLPTELSGVKVSNLPVYVKAHCQHEFSLVAESQTDTTNTYKCSLCETTKEVSRLSTITKDDNIICTVQISESAYYNPAMLGMLNMVDLESYALRFIPKTQLMGEYTIGTFKLVKSKSYETHIVLINTGDTKFTYEITVDPILINNVDISEYITAKIEFKEYAPGQHYEVMEKGNNQQVNLFFTVSSELPEEYVDLLVDNVSVHITLSEYSE